MEKTNIEEIKTMVSNIVNNPIQLHTHMYQFAHLHSRCIGKQESKIQAKNLSKDGTIGINGDLLGAGSVVSVDVASGSFGASYILIILLLVSLVLLLLFRSCAVSDSYIIRIIAPTEIFMLYSLWVPDMRHKRLHSSCAHCVFCHSLLE